MCETLCTEYYEPGEFRALIGASSADIRSSVKFKLR